MSLWQKAISRPWPAWVSAVLLAAALAGCGVPGEPLPPLLEIPTPVSDLSAAQLGARLRLTWSRPVLTTEGERIDQLGRMEIYEVFLPSGASLTNFAEQSKPLATLREGELSGQQSPQNYEIALNSSQIGQTAFFGIKAFSRKGREAGFSNISSLEIVNLPDPPADLQATVTEKAIELSWKAPERSVFGGPAPAIAGYRIVRTEAGLPPGEIAPALELGSVDGLTYQDSSFEFGHAYEYTVRAYVGPAMTAQTAPSASLEVTAKDVFPPAPPQNVRAIAVPGAVEISWSPNSEPDLAGYNVYRTLSEGRGISFSKLNPELLLIPIFRDPSITPGLHYTYHVTAVDKSGNESSPSEDVSLTAE